MYDYLSKNLTKRLPQTCELAISASANVALANSALAYSTLAIVGVASLALAISTLAY